MRSSREYQGTVYVFTIWQHQHSVLGTFFKMFLFQDLQVLVWTSCVLILRYKRAVPQRGGKELPSSKEDKMYYTAMCKGHINEPNIKEDKCYCTCGLNCQKNTSATQDQCNGHSLSEKYNCSLAGPNSANTPSHLKVDPLRSFLVTSQ